MVPPSLGFFRADGAYLINNGHLLVLWLGRDVSAAWITQVRPATASVRTTVLAAAAVAVTAQGGFEFVCQQPASCHMPAAGSAIVSVSMHLVDAMPLRNMHSYMHTACLSRRP
jgi:hypothetical protein